MNQRNIFINLGIDRFHYLLMQILRTTSYQDYFIQLHMAASIIFCIGVYNLRKIINFNQFIFVLLTPILFTIIYPHLWSCGYRQGVLTSVLFLIFSYVYKQTFYSKKVNPFYLIFLIFFAISTHWTSVFLVPLIFSENIFRFMKKVFKKIIALKLNKLFTIFLVIFILLIFYLTKYTNSIDHIVSKLLIYTFEDLFRESYGVKIPKLLFLAYLPQIILKFRKNWIFKNNIRKDLNFSSLNIVFISAVLSFFGIGGYLIRVYLPLTLIAATSNIIFYRYMSNTGRLSVIFSSLILFAGILYYNYTLLGNYISIDNYYLGFSKDLFR